MAFAYAVSCSIWHKANVFRSSPDIANVLEALGRRDTTSRVASELRRQGDAPIELGGEATSLSSSHFASALHGQTSDSTQM